MQPKKSLSPMKCKAERESGKSESLDHLPLPLSLSPFLHNQNHFAIFTADEKSSEASLRVLKLEFFATNRHGYEFISRKKVVKLLMIPGDRKEILSEKLVS